jgi:16S rRNA (cytidine1402-2'-O)-methyltransferase
VVVARELTKIHEEHWRGTLAEAVAWAGANEPRGEVVVVLDGAPPGERPDAAALEGAVAEQLAAGATPRDAAAAVAVDLGVPKRAAYEVAVRLRG